MHCRSKLHNVGCICSMINPSAPKLLSVRAIKSHASIRFLPTYRHSMLAANINSRCCMYTSNKKILVEAMQKPCENRRRRNLLQLTKNETALTLVKMYSVSLWWCGDSWNCLMNLNSIQRNRISFRPYSSFDTKSRKMSTSPTSPVASVY